MMVRQAGIHEGRWWLVLNFGMAAGNFGPNEEQTAPGVVLAVTGIAIQREAADQKAPNALAVDAAEVNPALAERSEKPAKPRRGKS